MWGGHVQREIGTCDLLSLKVLARGIRKCTGMLRELIDQSSKWKTWLADYLYSNTVVFVLRFRNNVTIREINPVLKEEFMLRAVASCRKLFALKFRSRD